MLFQSCNCDSIGSVNQNCDSSGNCSCKRNVVGKKCNQCASKYYGLSAQGCQVSIQQKYICQKTKKSAFKNSFFSGSLKSLNERSCYFSPATVTREALSTKTVIQAAIALVNVMLLARNVTIALQNIMDSQRVKDVGYVLYSKILFQKQDPTFGFL